MNLPNFNTISVGQYQELYRIGLSKDEDKDMRLVACLTGLTLTQVEDMRLDDYNTVCRAVGQLFSTEPNKRPRRRVRVAHRTYRVIYNPRQLSPGKYIEIQEWLKGGVIENLDKIMASLLTPVWWNRRKVAHPELCEAIRDLRFSVVHSASVFFCKLWQNSILALADCLDKLPESKTLSPKQRSDMKKLLQTASGGFTT